MRQISTSLAGQVEIRRTSSSAPAPPHFNCAAPVPRHLSTPGRQFPFTLQLPNTSSRSHANLPAPTLPSWPSATDFHSAPRRSGNPSHVVPAPDPFCCDHPAQGRLASCKSTRSTALISFSHPASTARPSSPVASDSSCLTPSSGEQSDTSRRADGCAGAPAGYGRITAAQPVGPTVETCISSRSS